MRVVLGLEYMGANFCGWQSQPSGCGIQDAVDRALNQFVGSADHARITSTVAGRTDAGVHALGQVVHFDSPVDRPEQAWVRGVNAQLPTSVRVLWAYRLPQELCNGENAFHARFSAFERRYRYLLWNDAIAPAIASGLVGFTHTPLELSKMREAAELTVGEHDFSAFRSAECQSKSPMKIMRRVQIEQDGNLVSFDFAANAFLHHMVRNLVGALVYVGSGKLSVAGFSQLLSARDRRLAPPTISPDGLYLTGVSYPHEYGIPHDFSRIPPLMRNLSALVGR